MRGTQFYIITITPFLRFIPACAGNTVISGVSTNTITVHPRVCGEHGGRDVRYSYHSGSSPRVRGTRDTVIGSLPIHRFIPACAGNTFRKRDMSLLFSVHPRVCGEHYFFHFFFLQCRGSSPRVRGTLTYSIEITDVFIVETFYQNLHPIHQRF